MRLPTLRRGPSMGICCWMALFTQNWDDIPEWLYQAIQDNKGRIRPAVQRVPPERAGAKG